MAYIDSRYGKNMQDGSRSFTQLISSEYLISPILAC